MNWIPMSDYPTPSDERSRIQAQTERKAELSNLAQRVDGSRMHPTQKRQANDHIQEQINETDRDIAHLRISQAVKKKADAAQRLALQQASVQNQRQVRQADDKRQTQRKTAAAQKLDVRA